MTKKTENTQVGRIHRGRLTKRPISATCIVACFAISIAPKVLAKPPKVSCSVDGQILVRGGGWTTIQVPSFPKVSVNANVVSYVAVDPDDQKLLYASDGDTVQRTRDGGCTWEKVWQTSVLPTSQTARDARIIDILVPTSPKGAGVVYLVVLNGVGAGLTNSQLVASNDAGATWTTYTPPAMGAFAVAPSDPQRLYLIENSWTNQAYCAIYTSADGGESWSLATDVAAERQQAIDNYSGGDLGGNGALDNSSYLHCKSDRAYVDPINPNSLWFFSTEIGRLYHSTDGGKTYTVEDKAFEPHGPGVEDMQITRHEGHPAIIRVFDAPDQFIGISNDDGGIWQQLPLKAADPTQGAVGVVEFGPDPFDIVTVREGQLERFDKRSNTWVDVPLWFAPSSASLASDGRSRGGYLYVINKEANTLEKHAWKF